MDFDLLTLFIFIIVIYMAILRMMGDEMLRVALTLIAVFMGLDYAGKLDSKAFLDRAILKVGLQRVEHYASLRDFARVADYKAETLKKFHKDSDSTTEDFTEEELSRKLDELIEGVESETVKSPDSTKLKPASERPRPLAYSENNYKKNIYDEIGSIGDNKLSRRMKYMSNMNRVAMDNQARVNKYTNIAYFEEELNDHENSVWWEDNEALENSF